MVPTFVISNAEQASTIRTILNAQQEKRSHLHFFSFGSHAIGICSYGNSPAVDCDAFHRQGSVACVFAGSILNKEMLGALLASYCPNGTLGYLTAAHMVHDIFMYMGQTGLKLIEGMYAFILLYEDGSLQAFRDDHGLMPVYYTEQLGSLWILNEAKLLVAENRFDLRLKPRTDFDSSQELPCDYSIFVKIHKVPPGGSLATYAINKSALSIGQPVETQLADARMDESAAMITTNALLRRSVNLCIGDDKNVSVILSGGLDSSFVTALAKTRNDKLHTLSMGTELSNEFPWAEKVARHVGTSHQEFIIERDDILRGILLAIWENEIFDGLSAEIHAPFAFLYEQAAKWNGKLLTGYGADLLFGGTIQLGTPIEHVNGELLRQIARTKWTGEFSPFLARKYAISVEFPYWNTAVMRLAKSLDSNMKFDGQEVKPLLRKTAEQENLLPHEIVWRQKIGIHEASSINCIFSQYLGLDSAQEYYNKDTFVYYVFKELFENRVPLEHIDLIAIAGRKQNVLAPTIQTEHIVQETINNEDGVLLVQFNHTNRHNPFSKAMERAVITSLHRAASDPQVKAVVLTGGLDRSFSAGGDFNEVKMLKGGDEVDAWIDGIIDLYTSVLKVNKPTIAALDHYAIGIGFQLALMFDWRLGTDRCVLSMPELKNGISCTLGACILDHFVGRHGMTKIVFGCEDLSAAEALKDGLLNEIVEPAQFLQRAMQVAKKFTRFSPISYAKTKDSANRRFIQELNCVAASSKEAHRAAFKENSGHEHFKKILKDKYF